MTEPLTGFQALEHLNSFMSHHQNELMPTEASTRKHASFARGNEVVPSSQLRAAKAFGGDLHGKIRSMVGSLGGLVDRDALPDPVKHAWDALDAARKRYVAEVNAVRSLVDEKHPLLYEGTQYPYMSLHQLLEFAAEIDPAYSAQKRKELSEMIVQYSRMRAAFLADLEDCTEVPLRLKQAKDGAMSEHDVTFTVPNEFMGTGQSALEHLVLLRMVKESQLNNLVSPADVREVGLANKILPGVTSTIFSEIQKMPGSEAFVSALDQKIKSELRQYYTVMDKRYAAKLQNEAPELYAEYCALRDALGPVAEIDAATVENHALALESGHTQEAPSKCPYSRFLNMIGAGKSGENTNGAAR